MSRPHVVIIGAGASGTLAAIHLVRESGRRAVGVDITLLDPADHWGRGTAFGTVDDQHLLNVPAAGMSALPEDPSHFVQWRGGEAYEFAPRRDYGRYLEELLTTSLAGSLVNTTVHHVRARATGIRQATSGVRVSADNGEELSADAVVLGCGLPAAGSSWAPRSVRDSAFFVDDPWAPGALDVVRRDRTGPADVLVVGTGLTMVDVVLSLTGERNPGDRVIHAVSRSARLPKVHAPELRPAVIPDISTWGHTLDELRCATRDHLAAVALTTGDWRPGMDGIRFQVTALWDRLSEQDRLEFLSHDAGEWNVLRHRLPPSSAGRLDELRLQERLAVHAAEVLDAQPLPLGGLRVGLSDGSSRDVGWVVNCTGPQTDVRVLGDPLIDDLLRPRAGSALATPATAGMGVRTENGRLVDTDGSSRAPIWALGALRRGELWESTAVPEIRTQALAVATSVLDAIAPAPRRLADGRLVGGHHPAARPRDPLGLPLSTTAEAAALYNAGLERVMRLQDGGEDLLRDATQVDPDFAIAHAALALLGHEAGATTDVQASLRAARSSARRRADERERSFVDVVGVRVKDARRAGARALMAHIAQHPRDALAVSAAVPTIAFSGVTDVQQEAWELVEGLAPAYGDHWWYISLLAFTRQDQSRFDEAGLLAESALSCEPSSGHAVHALTHVLYETGQHDVGRTWLDHWVGSSGQSASHRAHFSWHAALHELALGDLEAVRHRYYSQLAPPGVSGVRALVDSASLLWRWKVTMSQLQPAETPPVAPVLEQVDPELLTAPTTPFIALHAALAHAGNGDAKALESLSRHCRDSHDPAMRGTAATICEALTRALDQDHGGAAAQLQETMPRIVALGGSAAQREVLEETLIDCLIHDGQIEAARRMIDDRLERRPSPLDSRRRDLLTSAKLAG
ncbi:putative NAD(P)/FAD-binding protein YdhS [Marmoricola sp. URHA0025 HA25]